MRKQSLVALLGATALMALPVMTPDLAGGGSYAYAAGARGGDANGGNGARGGRGGRGGDGGKSDGRRAVGVRAATAAPAVSPRASGAQPLPTAPVAARAEGRRTLLPATAALVP